MAPLLTAKKLTKKFLYPTPVEILKNISLEVNEGECVAIVGKSGEGKSTLLHILGTIDTPTSGELHIFEKGVDEHSTEVLRNKHFGFIFQAFHLLQDATVLENVLMPVKIARKSTRAHSSSHIQAQELLKQVGLEKRLHYSVDKLSGGEKQRVAIARALINDPDILFADEPTGNLDHTTASEVVNLLFSLTRNTKKTMLIVTHNLELANRCDTILYLEDGVLVSK